MTHFLRGTFLGIGFLVLLAANGFGQKLTPDANLPPMHASYVEATAPVSLNAIQGTSSTPLLIFPKNGAKTSRGIFSKDANAVKGSTTIHSAGASAAQSRASQHDPDADDSTPVGGNIPGLDTVATFSGAFAGQGGPDAGLVFPFVMIGGHPLAGRTTTLPTKITAISLQLLNPDGSVNVNMPFKQFEDHLLDSPNFSESNYRSGRNIQFGDAVQRAEFFNTMEENWHTRLRPRIVDRVTLQIPRFVKVQLLDGSVITVQAYRVGTAPNGDPFVLILDLLFQNLDFNQTVNEINAGNNTTNALNVNAYPNTFLFSIDATGALSSCCVLGFHNFVFDSTVVPQPRWITVFASWISPGVFGGGTADVTALSHEISEAMNDPFGDTQVPFWQFPGVPADDNFDCQGNLETGDPVEVLPVSTVAITNRERHDVFTFHPQTEALLQWFEMGAKSDAIDGAFTFPDETALTHSALPCPL